MGRYKEAAHIAARQADIQEGLVDTRCPANASVYLFLLEARKIQQARPSQDSIVSLGGRVAAGPADWAPPPLFY